MKLKRPIGMDNRNDPEEQYRAGFLHGAQAVRALFDEDKLNKIDLRKWVEIDLQRWRYDETSNPFPPAYDDQVSH